MRVENHPILGPAPKVPAVRFFFNGSAIMGHEGEPIAAALLANGIRTLRRTRHVSAPRGLYCGIGHCFECRVTVDGVDGIRSCLTPITEGMRVQSEVPAPTGGGRPDGTAR